MTKHSTTPQTQPDGTVEQVDGRTVLHFERRFRHPIERVWDALTRPEELAKWVGEAEVTIDLREGGEMVSRTTGPPELIEAMVKEGGADPNDLVSRDTILRVDPPRLFEHTFGGVPTSIARWELEPDGDGTRLTLRHTEPPEFEAKDETRDLAGWHSLLEELEHVLDGKPATWSMRRWEEHRKRYDAARS
jgi:uncharacterized protein YndB with AHSA1/START domain